MRAVLFLIVGALIEIVAVGAPHAQQSAKATLYKSPQCDCCDDYAEYLRGNGLQVTVIPTPDLATVSRNAGVPERLEACHTMLIEGYVVEGHVPVSIVRRLLAERPAVKGITMPGMPSGSPGMTGAKEAPFVVLTIPKDGGRPTIYARE
jgi:hypothetical protein